jgi:hypothetical protein
MPARNERPARPDGPLEFDAGRPDNPVGHPNPAVPAPPGAIDVMAARITAGLLPFEESRAATEILGLRTQHAAIVAEIGRRLFQAREYYAAVGFRGDQKGDGFAAFCGTVDINRRTAYNYINVAERLAEVGILDGSPILKLSAGTTKLLAIAEADPETVGALERGEQVPGIGTLDDVDRMRAGELRRKIRELQTANQRTARLVTSLESENRELGAKLADAQRTLVEGPTTPTPLEEEFAGLVARIAKWAQAAKDRPRAEREAAYPGIVIQYDAVAKLVMRALVPERSGELPLPDTDIEEGG